MEPWDRCSCCGDVDHRADACPTLEETFDSWLESVEAPMPSQERPEGSREIQA